MRVRSISNFNPSFAGKEQNFKKFAPILKVAAKPAKEHPKTFLEKLGRGLEYAVIKFCHFCFG